MALRRLFISVSGETVCNGGLVSFSFKVSCRGVRGIFFLRGQSHSSCFFRRVKFFFPVKNAHFNRPLTNFIGFKNEKQKKKNKQTNKHTNKNKQNKTKQNKKQNKTKTNKQTNKQTNKKNPSPHFCNFSSFHFNFPPFPFRFSFFSSLFSPFSFPLFSQYVSRNFPVENVWAPNPPAATPLVYGIA